MFAPDRFATILAIAVFLLAGELLSRKVDGRFSTWSWGAVIAFGTGARLGHVIEHIGSFAADPIRILYVWQGGFMVAGGISLAVAYTIWAFRQHFRLVL